MTNSPWMFRAAATSVALAMAAVPFQAFAARRLPDAPQPGALRAAGLLHQQEVQAVKKHYENQPSARHSVEPEVTHWVKVPYNEARHRVASHRGRLVPPE